MKTSSSLFIFLCTFVLFSCQTITNEPEVSWCYNEYSLKTKASPSKIFKVSFDDAVALAKAHYKEGNISIDPYCLERDTLLYICSSDKGWMIIAADKRANPILAESKNGKLPSYQELPQGILTWIESIASDIKCIKEESEITDNEYTAFWELFSKKAASLPTKNRDGMKWYAVYSQPILTNSLETDVIPHLISTQWGQGSPWNSKCPLDANNDYKKCVLGCMATAVGQIVYYTHFNLYKPDALYHTIYCTNSYINGPTYDIGFVRDDLNNPSTRWNSMALTKYDSSTGIEYAGDLMLDIGNRLGLKYSSEGTGTSSLSSSAISTYYHLLYSTGNYNYSTVLSNLNNGIPVLISAYSTFQWLTYSDGHMWIIDGVRETERTYEYTIHFEYSEDWIYYSEVYDTFEEIHQLYHIQDPYEEIDCITSTTTNYLLMNWGYNGQFDNDSYSVLANENWYANEQNHQYERIIYYGIH